MSDASCAATVLGGGGSGGGGGGGGNFSRLVYVDRCNNRFVFTRRADADVVDIAYEGVRPEHSSSGHYSGGTDFRTTLSSEQRAALERATASLCAPTARARARSMGTSIVRVDDAEQFLVRFNCDEQKAFEALVESFRPA